VHRRDDAVVRDETKRLFRGSGAPPAAARGDERSKRTMSGSRKLRTC